MNLKLMQPRQKIRFFQEAILKQTFFDLCIIIVK